MFSDSVYLLWRARCDVICSDKKKAPRANNSHFHVNESLLDVRGADSAEKTRSTVVLQAAR